MTHSPTAPRLGRRPSLDGLRALAVALVIAIHVGLLTAGYIGVDVFLPLSGFLITTLLYEEWERSGTISLRRFFARRARRLLPALGLLLLGYGLVMGFVHPWGVRWPLRRAVATTALFANNWIATLVPAHGSAVGALSPTWTLAEEGQFYVLWPCILLLLLRRGVGPRRVLAMLAAAAVALVAAGLVAAGLDPVYNAYTDPLARGGELLLGGAASIIWRERLVPAPLRHPLAGWLAFGGLGALVATGRPAAHLWYLTAAVLSAMLIVNLVARPAGARAPLRRGLRSRPLVATGRVSYGIYLFHVPIYYLVWTYLRLEPAYLYWPVVLGLAAGLAGLSWRLIEAPVLGRPYRARSPRRPSSNPRFA